MIAVLIGVARTFTLGGKLFWPNSRWKFCFSGEILVLRAIFVDLFLVRLIKILVDLFRILTFLMKLFVDLF